MGLNIDIDYINLEVFIKKMGFSEIVREEERKTSHMCGKEQVKTLKHKELPFFAEHISGQYIHDTEHMSETRRYERARIYGEGLMFTISVGGPYFPTIITRGNIENILPFSKIIRETLPKRGGKIGISPPKHNVEDVLRSLTEVLGVKITKTEVLYGSMWEDQGIEATYIVE